MTCKSEENYKLLAKADAIWPKAVLTQSGILLGWLVSGPRLSTESRLAILLVVVVIVRLATSME